MKSILRSILINSSAIFTTSKILTGLNYGQNISTLFFAGIALTLVNLLVKPIIRILTLPINLLTLGIFSWAIDILMIFLVTLIIPGFNIAAFSFPGLSFQGLIIPAFYVSTFFSFLLSAIFISFIASFLSWLID
ncbi:MAG: phage holin family protein [Patescibacteria group bacterium]